MELDKRSVYFTWDAVRCEDWNGIFGGYKFRLTDLTNSRVADMGVVNDTELRRNNLTPYTQYEMRIWVLNHAFGGPQSEPHTFSTPEDGEFPAGGPFVGRISLAVCMPPCSALQAPPGEHLRAQCRLADHLLAFTTAHQWCHHTL